MTVCSWRDFRIRKLILSLCLSPLSVSVSPSLCVYLSLSMCLSLPLSVSVSPSLCVCLSLSVPHLRNTRIHTQPTHTQIRVRTACTGRQAITAEQQSQNKEDRSLLSEFCVTSPVSVRFCYIVKRPLQLHDWVRDTYNVSSFHSEPTEENKTKTRLTASVLKQDPNT